MVARATNYRPPFPHWTACIKQLLIDAENYRDDVSIQVEVIEQIFNIIVENIIEVKTNPRFAAVVCQKLIEFQHSFDPFENDFFQKFSFIIDVLQQV